MYGQPIQYTKHSQLIENQSFPFETCHKSFFSLSFDFNMPTYNKALHIPSNIQILPTWETCTGREREESAAYFYYNLKQKRRKEQKHVLFEWYGFFSKEIKIVMNLCNFLRPSTILHFTLTLFFIVNLSVYCLFLLQHLTYVIVTRARAAASSIASRLFFFTSRSQFSWFFLLVIIVS